MWTTWHLYAALVHFESPEILVHPCRCPDYPHHSAKCQQTMGVLGRRWWQEVYGLISTSGMTNRLEKADLFGWALHLCDFSLRPTSRSVMQSRAEWNLISCHARCRITYVLEETIKAVFLGCLKGQACSFWSVLDGLTRRVCLADIFPRALC